MVIVPWTKNLYAGIYKPWVYEFMPYWKNQSKFRQKAEKLDSKLVADHFCQPFLKTLQPPSQPTATSVTSVGSLSGKGLLAIPGFQVELFTH